MDGERTTGNSNGHATANGNGTIIKEPEPDALSELGEKKDWKYFWGRVMADIRNKDLVPVKVLFFFKYGTLFILYPFLTLHMAELGLNEWEIGVNQATAPLVSVLGPPFMGVLADRIGNFKILLSVTTLVNAGLALLLLAVPKARETALLPAFMTFEMSCENSISEHFILKSIDTQVCTLNAGEKVPPTWENLPSRSLHCGRVCPISGKGQKETLLDPYSDLEGMHGDAMLYPDGKRYIEFFKEKVPHLICSGQKCYLDFTPLDMKNGTFANQTNPLVEVGLLTFLNQSSGFKVNVTQVHLEISSSLGLNGIKYDNAVCTSPNSTLGYNKGDDDCKTQCLVQYQRALFCSNQKEEKVYNVQLTFGIYTLFRMLLGFASSTSFIMFEGAVLAIMKQYGGDYGLQRVFATLAAIVVAPLSGLMLKSLGFRPVIILYAATNALSAFVTLSIDLEFKKPAEKVMKNLKQVLSQGEILIFFVAMLWSGTLWGYLETFLFLYLERMGGSRLLMGLTISVGGLAGIPLLIFSRPIIKRFGHVNCLCLGLLFYGFRYFGYSIITNPWQCLIFEALEAITVSLAITAASIYAVALSKLQTIATIQGIFGCLYFGIGRGAGSVVGGILIRNFGHVETFRIFGVSSFTGAMLYFLVNVLYLRKHSIAHTGLDMNKLHLHSQDELSEKKNKPEKLKRESANGKPTSTENGRTQPVILDGGYVGPLGVKEFTDVPLDEDGQ